MVDLRTLIHAQTVQDGQIRLIYYWKIRGRLEYNAETRQIYMYIYIYMLCSDEEKMYFHDQLFTTLRPAVLIFTHCTTRESTRPRRQPIVCAYMCTDLGQPVCGPVCVCVCVEGRGEGAWHWFVSNCVEDCEPRPSGASSSLNVYLRIFYTHSYIVYTQ